MSHELHLNFGTTSISLELAFEFWDPLIISGAAKATNSQKLSVRKTKISGHSLLRGSGAEPIVEGGGEEGFGRGGKAPR